MSYKALLFCPDEKTARTVTQVLSELDFQVEPCNEPFGAVKKLTAEHFDAIVVDCENEQNALLLFKSAKNSGSNQTSLSIAVVEGQAGVAKAFRIGANLVLTKPINVEQSKGTIRVARGLLRKSEAAKASSPAEPQARTVAPNIRSVAPAPSAAQSSAFELENEPEAKPEPTEAALLESMPDPAADLPRTATPAPSFSSPKPAPWQPISQPMATALRNAAEASGQSPTSSQSIAASPIPTGISGMGAAAAPARQKEIPVQDTKSEEMDLPMFRTEIGTSSTASSSGGSIKYAIAAVILIVAAGAGYVGWEKMHHQSDMDAVVKPVQQPVAPAIQPQVPSLPIAATDNSPKPSTPTSLGSPAAPSPSAENPVRSEKSSSEKPAAKQPKKAAPSPTSEEENGSAAEETEDVAPAIVVSGGSHKVAQPAPATVADATAPAALGIAESKNEAISGLVSVTPSVPHTAPQTLKVSQGVSQGLLVKKVPPAYPQQAVQMKVQGAVQISATITKEGDTTNVKVLSGDPLLARAAVDAVKQWKYKPYYLDTEPVAIQTTITVNFKLP